MQSHFTYKTPVERPAFAVFAHAFFFSIRSSLDDNVVSAASSDDCHSTGGKYWEFVYTTGVVLTMEHYCHFHTRSNEAQESLLFIVLYAHPFPHCDTDAKHEQKSHSEINYCAAPSTTFDCRL